MEAPSHRFGEPFLLKEGLIGGRRCLHAGEVEDVPFRPGLPQFLEQMSVWRVLEVHRAIQVAWTYRSFQAVLFQPWHCDGRSSSLVHSVETVVDSSKS